MSIFIYLFIYLFTFFGDLFLDVYLQLVQLSHAHAHEAIHVTHFNPTEGRRRDENHADSPEGCVHERVCARARVVGQVELSDELQISCCSLGLASWD